MMHLKSIQKIIFDRIYEHYYQQFFENQYGFRKACSATLQLLTFLNSVFRRLDKCNPGQDSITFLYLDFAKAFDTVPEEVNIEKKTFLMGDVC